MKSYQEILYELGLNILEGLNILLSEDISDIEKMKIESDKEDLQEIIEYGVNGDYEIEKVLSLAMRYRRVE
jgi:hypothetical protein